MASNLRPTSQSLLGLAVTGLCLSPAGIALAADDSEALKEVVVVGTRFAGHSADESLAPVDVVTTDDMRQSAALPGEVGAARTVAGPESGPDTRADQRQATAWHSDADH